MISIIGLYHMEVLYIYKVLLLLYEDAQIYFTDNLNKQPRQSLTNISVQVLFKMNDIKHPFQFSIRAAVYEEQRMFRFPFPAGK